MNGKSTGDLREMLEQHIPSLKEKGNKDSQVNRNEDAESEDCPPDGLPIAIARKLLQGDNGQQRENRFIIVVHTEE